MTPARQRDDGDSKRTPKESQKASQKAPKMMKKREKATLAKNCFFSFFENHKKTQNCRSTSPELSSHAGKTAIFKVAPKTQKNIKK
jgi:hypothetical protein